MTDTDKPITTDNDRLNYGGTAPTIENGGLGEGLTPVKCAECGRLTSKPSDHHGDCSQGVYDR